MCWFGINNLKLISCNNMSTINFLSIHVCGFSHLRMEHECNKGFFKVCVDNVLGWGYLYISEWTKVQALYI